MRGPVREHLARIISSRTREEWAAFNASENVGISPVLGLAELLSKGLGASREVTVKANAKEFKAIVRIDTPQEVQYYQHGGILQYVLRQLLAGK